MINTCIRAERITEVNRKFAWSGSTTYLRVKNGLLPPPFSLGGRASAWLSHETSAVLAAMAAGQSNEQIKCLVKKLIDERQPL